MVKKPPRSPALHPGKRPSGKKSFRLVSRRTPLLFCESRPLLYSKRKKRVSRERKKIFIKTFFALRWKSHAAPHGSKKSIEVRGLSY
jgi:hypothetical protein